MNEMAILEEIALELKQTSDKLRDCIRRIRMNDGRRYRGIKEGREVK